MSRSAAVWNVIGGATASRSAVVGAVLLALLTYAVWLVAPPPARAATVPTVVTLTFDDANADQFDAQRMMTDRGMAATFYVPTGWVGRDGYLTREQLSTMAANGHEIGGHTVTHADLAVLPLPEAEAEICDGRTVLESWGFRPTSFSYPFMQSTLEVEELTAKCGYLTARGLGDIRSATGCPQCPFAETLPPQSPNYLRAPAQVDASWTLKQMETAVTDASDGDGGWVILTFHGICAPIGTAACPANQSTTPAVFEQFVSWLAAHRDDLANNTVVQTVNQTVRQYLGGDYPAYQPAEPATSRPPAPLGVNALGNPSVEDEDPATGLPACWQTAGWGRNTATWKTVSPGRTGDRARQVSITGYIDGDAKLVPTMDLYTCAPTVQEGKNYEVSVWYRSTGTIQFVLYYRDTEFSWIGWTSGPLIRPTATPGTWTEATLVTPPVPAGATAMSFGLALVGDGTLTTDDYGLVETREQPAPPLAAAAENGLPSFLRSPFTWVVVAVLVLQALLFFRRPVRPR